MQKETENHPLSPLLLFNCMHDVDHTTCLLPVGAFILSYLFFFAAYAADSAANSANAMRIILIKFT